MKPDEDDGIFELIIQKTKLLALQLLCLCPPISRLRLNDDEVHFAAPWEHDLTTEAAVAQLIEVATGGAYEPGLINEPFGVSRGDAGKRVTMF